MEVSREDWRPAPAARRAPRRRPDPAAAPRRAARVDAGPDVGLAVPLGAQRPGRADRRTAGTGRRPGTEPAVSAPTGSRSVSGSPAQATRRTAQRRYTATPSTTFEHGDAREQPGVRADDRARGPRPWRPAPSPRAAGRPGRAARSRGPAPSTGRERSSPSYASSPCRSPSGCRCDHDDDHRERRQGRGDVREQVADARRRGGRHAVGTDRPGQRQHHPAGLSHRRPGQQPDGGCAGAAPRGCRPSCVTAARAPASSDQDGASSGAPIASTRTSAVRPATFETVARNAAMGTGAPA